MNECADQVAFDIHRCINGISHATPRSIIKLGLVDLSFRPCYRQALYPP